MGAPVYFDGIVDLKEGVTLTTIVNAYREASGYDPDEQPALELETEGEYLDEGDEVRLTVEGGQLQYHVDQSNGSYTFVGEFEDFLKTVAEEHAAKGWISWEGEPGDDQTEVPYGPDERTKQWAVVELASQNLKTALDHYNQAVDVFTKIITDAAAGA